jgi:hemoglobin
MRSTLCFALLLAGCAPKAAVNRPVTQAPRQTPKDERSLYDRLGGLDAITAVVAEFVDRNVHDPRVKLRFHNTDPVHLQKMLVELVCMATGGPCKYSGRDMKESHAGMDLVGEEFDAVVENLKGALDKFHVGAVEENQLLGALGPMRPQIVAPADRFHPIDAARLESADKLAHTLSGEAQELLAGAIVAGRRGQRSYAEQLFSRAELLTGRAALAAIAPVFREGGPPRVETALEKFPPATPPQPRAIGSSDEDEPEKRPPRGSLKGMLRLDQKPLTGMGVVMLEPVSGKWKPRTPKQRVLEQRGRQFAPRIMAVPVGSTVSFPNFDPLFHNVFSISKTRPFDLGIYKNGESRAVTFEKEGIVQLGCNLHANMAAHLIVVAAPHYAVVDGDGKFYFRNVAPGRYWVKAWGEGSAEPVKSQIEIKAGGNETALDLKEGAPVNTDKFGVSRLLSN